MSESRNDILARISSVQDGSGSASEISEALASLKAPPPAPLESDDIVEAFVIQLLQNKATLELAADRSGAVRCIAQYVYRNYNTHRMVAGYDPRLAALPWRDGGVLVRFDAAADSDPVSVSYARLAIAEAGAMMLYSNRTNPARNNWLVQDHLVVVDVKDVVASYEEAWSQVTTDRARGETPRGVHFIAGPSTTGDIIGHMVTGAHGPTRLHVILRGHLDEELRQHIEERL